MKSTVFTSLLFIAISCSPPTEEELRKKEQEKLDTYLSNTTLTFYKAVKVALKCSADPAQDPEVAKASSTILILGIRGASIMSDSTQSISITELIAAGSEFYAARDILTKKNEDDFPTILDNIRTISAGKPQQPLVLGSITYDKNFEHVILGLLWTASHTAPPEFPLYELDKVENGKIADPFLKVVTDLSKSLAYSNNEFPWKALDQSAECIYFLEANKEQLIAHPAMRFNELSTPEQSYYELHLLALALHGVSHLDLEHEEPAIKDFEGVLEDAEKAGMDNELTWLVGAYVHIHNEEMEKAIVDLEKLERSTKLSESDKKAADEIKEYLKTRENGKAFNAIRDKMAISTISFRLFMNRIEELEQLKQIRSNSEGKRMCEIQDRINENSGDIEKLSELNVDSLASKAEGLVKSVLGN